MRGRTVRRVVACLSTIACCIALPGSVRAAGDDTQTAAPAKSTKSTAKSSNSSKSKSSSSKSSKPSTKSSASKSKGTGGKSTASRSSSKSSKASASAKKPAAAPATKSTDAVRAAFDPALPTTSIPGAPAATASAAAPGQRGPTRIDFDDRLIQGQRNTAGAVYLYDRKELKQRSMIKKRESFREEIVGVVYDSEL